MPRRMIRPVPLGLPPRRNVHQQVEQRTGLLQPQLSIKRAAGNSLLD
jgi:hypothetical protein